MVSHVGGRPCNNTDAAYLASWFYSLLETRTKKTLDRYVIIDFSSTAFCFSL